MKAVFASLALSASLAGPALAHSASATHHTTHGTSHPTASHNSGHQTAIVHNTGTHPTTHGTNHPGTTPHAVSHITSAKPSPGPHGPDGQKPSGPISHPVPHPNGAHVDLKYHLKHGTPFAGGYCYFGRSHSHWTYRGYCRLYGCVCYWCPSTSCYYYWCEPTGCYYPVSYHSCAPVVKTVSPTVVVMERPVGVPVLPE